MVRFSEVRRIAEDFGLDLKHECNLTASECYCPHTDEAVDKRWHVSGDVRCMWAKSHTICAHDKEALAAANIGYGECDSCMDFGEVGRFSDTDQGERFERTDGSVGRFDLMLCDSCGSAYMNYEDHEPALGE